MLILLNILDVILKRSVETVIVLVNVFLVGFS